jgi:hypothetical protein
MIFLFYFVVFITLHYNHMYIHQIIELQLLLLIYYIIITRIYLVVYVMLLLMIIRCISWWYILWLLWWCFEILILYTTSLYLSPCLLLLSCFVQQDFNKTTDTTSPSSFVFEPLSSITTKNCIRLFHIVLFITLSPG